MLTPEAIQTKEFEQSVLGGYRRDEVDSFLDEVEADYRKLYVENNELVEKLKVCLAKIEDYKKDEEFLKTAIINAQKLNETTLREIELREKEVEVSSKAKAAEIIAAAEEQAKEIMLKAERESADAIRAAQERCRNEIEAEQAKSAAEIARIRSETDVEQQKLDYLHGEVSEFKNTIIELYKAHLTSISKLPDFKPSEEVTVEASAAEAPVAQPEPEIVNEVAEAEATVEETNPDGNTMEFKLKEKEETANEAVPSAKPSKFENLKFGIDYDINADK